MSRISQALTAGSQILEPPPERNAGTWADENRILPPESPEPGRWRTDRVPFWRAIYDAFADNQHDMIVVVCGAQMSKTEGMFNVIGHRFTDGPYCPALYIGPTEKQVKSISKDRIDKMLRSTSALWYRTAKGQRYGVYEKWIGGVRLGFAWAGSATELASHPAGLVLIDERDRMGSDVGNEGDPVSLARARAKNYPNKKIGVFSTPTVEGASPIWTLFDEGARSMWAWPCTSCFKFFVPRLELLRWPDGVTADQALTRARVVCPHCGVELDDRDKAKMNTLGRYIRHRELPEGETTAGAVFGKYMPDPNPDPTKTASFWISGLASPWVRFGEVAKVMIEAYKSGDPAKIQAEINTWGGELYKMRGDAPDWEEVSANRLEYTRGWVPDKVQMITMGADVQKDGIFYVIRGWGYNAESWSLDHDYITGDTEHDPVWLRLQKIIEAGIGDRVINRAFVDSGYRPGDRYKRPDHAVYSFARRMPGLVFPTKGHDAMDTPYRHKDIDYTAGGLVIRNGVRLYHLNAGYWKSWVHARVSWPDDQPGGWHLFRETTDDYCKQIVAEELVQKPSGAIVWVVKSRNNHYLDCEVGAAAAAATLNVHRLPDVTPDKPPENRATARQPEPRKGYERRGL